jgi:hypothetical protein
MNIKKKSPIFSIFFLSKKLYGVYICNRSFLLRAALLGKSKKVSIFERRELPIKCNIGNREENFSILKALWVFK